jgi:hypothetical protein
MKNGQLLLWTVLLLTCTVLLTTQLIGHSVSAIKVKKPVVTRQFELTAGRGKYFSFIVPQGVRDVYLSGKVKVIGGIIPEINIGLFYAKNCPTSGNSVHFYFGQCKPIFRGNYDNKHAFARFIQSGQKYYILFKNNALYEEKSITPFVTVSYYQ